MVLNEDFSFDHLGAVGIHWIKNQLNSLLI
jgi:hypothetical protein